MKTVQELIHDLHLQLEKENDLLNGYRTKVTDLHKKIRNHAYLILNSTPCNLAYHSAQIAKYSALLEEYNTEIKMLEKSIEIANDDIADLLAEREGE